MIINKSENFINLNKIFFLLANTLYEKRHSPKVLLRLQSFLRLRQYFHHRIHRTGN